MTTKQQAKDLENQSVRNLDSENNTDRGNNFVYSGECCPVCGSSNYTGGAMGGRCFECGHAFGFHGTSEALVNEKNL